MTFRHIGVGNVSRALQKEVVLPLYVIATKPLDTWENASEYTPVYASANVTVLRKSEHNKAVRVYGIGNLADDRTSINQRIFR
jgi:hypothetical protein